MSFKIDRHRYAELFGPTEGDSIRLGDTDLFIKIERIIQDMAMSVNLVEVKLLETVWDKMLHKQMQIQRLQI